MNKMFDIVTFVCCKQFYFLTNLKFELKFCESPRSSDDFNSFYLMQIFELIYFSSISSDRHTLQGQLQLRDQALDPVF